MTDDPNFARRARALSDAAFYCHPTQGGSPELWRSASRLYEDFIRETHDKIPPTRRVYRYRGRKLDLLRGCRY